MRSLIQPLTLVLRSLDTSDKNRFRQTSSGTTAGVRRVFWRTIIVYGVIGLAAVGVISVFRVQIIALVYHGKYEGFGVLLIGFGAYATLLGLGYPVQSVVYTLGRQRAFARLTLLGALFGGACSIALCWRFGVWGAMGATVLSIAIVLLGGLVVIRDLIVGRTGNSPLPKPGRSTV
jgi:O-antigen/teichoic acid export membrane protein